MSTSVESHGREIAESRASGYCLMFHALSGFASFIPRCEGDSSGSSQALLLLLVRGTIRRSVAVPSFCRSTALQGHRPFWTGNET